MLQRILIVDDSEIIKLGLKAMLSDWKGEIHFASDEQSCEEALQKHTYDVVLMDIDMPGKNGIEITCKLVAFYPELKIIMISVFDTRENVEQAILSGAKGFLSKLTEKDELHEAIKTVIAGKEFVSMGILGKMNLQSKFLKKAIKQFEMKAKLKLDKLSITERKILSLIAQGHLDKEIAEMQGITLNTANSHRKKILQKTGCRNAVELVALVFQSGI
jgi:DNA-binding NarL/FixJ family response regulator